MEVEVNRPVKVKVATINVHAKVSDRGNYTLLDSEGTIIKESEGYVPSFFSRAALWRLSDF